MDFFVPLDVGISTGLIYAWPVIALAIAFRILAFPDLTIEGSFPLGAATFGILVKNGVPAPFAVISGVGAGAVAGCLTAFFHVRFRINKLLAGIIVVAITYTMSLRIMGASNVGLLEQPSIFNVARRWDQFAGGRFHAGTLLVLAVLVIIVGIGSTMALSTRPGLRLRVAGANPEYARLLGIHVPVNLVIGLGITNGLAAMGGVLAAMNQGFADVGMGQGILILALAAMTIGERLVPARQLSYQSYVLLAALTGAVVYEVLVSYALWLGLAATDLKLATAVLVLLVIALKVTKNGQLFLEDLK
jgi:putative tryptophan/tyrosine transport system permease protein